MEKKTQLPIFYRKEEIIAAIAQNDVTIITGDTGCGKTTQVPQYILQSLLNENSFSEKNGNYKEEGNKDSGRLIGITQPRRISAISVADRVAKELNSKVGKRVGYEIRFEHRTSDETKIKFMTEGILLKELLKLKKIGDKYSHVIIDEAHERSINGDLILGIVHQQLRKTIRRRKKKKNSSNDLKFVIMSATLESQKLIDYFSSLSDIRTGVV